MHQESVLFYLGSREQPQCGKQRKEIYKNYKQVFVLLLTTTFSIIQDHIFAETITRFSVLSVLNSHGELTVE
jgi:glutaredoxin-related protein